MKAHESPKDAAIRLIAQVAPGRFPVPVTEIAEHLNAKSFADLKYPTSGSGHVEVRPDGSFAIIVNSKHSPERKRFTIAHEIAHLIYDHDYLQTHGAIDRNGNAADDTYRQREQRANAFAAELLMPEDDFIRQFLALRSIEKVADYFFVSKQAASIRAVNLGLSEVTE